MGKMGTPTSLPGERRNADGSAAERRGAGRRHEAAYGRPAAGGEGGP